MKKSRIQTMHVRQPNPAYLAFRNRAESPSADNRLALFDEAWHAIRKGSQRRRLLGN